MNEEEMTDKIVDRWAKKFNKSHSGYQGEGQIYEENIEELKQKLRKAVK